MVALCPVFMAQLLTVPLFALLEVLSGQVLSGHCL